MASRLTSRKGKPSGVVPTDKVPQGRLAIDFAARAPPHPIELIVDPISKIGRDCGNGRVPAVNSPQLVDTLDFQIYLGDAWTDPSRLEVIPLPNVQPKLTVSPPAYARAVASKAADEGTPGVRQLSVLEGSRVDLEIQCLNKPLVAATAHDRQASIPAAKSRCKRYCRKRHWCKRRCEGS